MIRFVILILILAAVCAVYTLHAKMEENEAKKGEKSGEKIIDDMIKNNVIDEIAKGKDRG